MQLDEQSVNTWPCTGGTGQPGELGLWRHSTQVNVHYATKSNSRTLMQERCRRWSPNEGAKIVHTSLDVGVLQGLSAASISILGLFIETIQDFKPHHKMLDND